MIDQTMQYGGAGGRFLSENATHDSSRIARAFKHREARRRELSMKKYGPWCETPGWIQISRISTAERFLEEISSTKILYIIFIFWMILTKLTNNDVCVQNVYVKCKFVSIDVKMSWLRINYSGRQIGRGAHANEHVIQHWVRTVWICGWISVKTCVGLGLTKLKFGSMIQYKIY